MSVAVIQTDCSTGADCKEYAKALPHPNKTLLASVTLEVHSQPTTSLSSLWLDPCVCQAKSKKRAREDKAYSDAAIEQVRRLYAVHWCCIHRSAFWVIVADEKDRRHKRRPICTITYS